MKEVIARILSYKTFYKLFAFENLIPVMMLSFVAWYISYTNNITTTYNDAMSHLNISRSVFDNLEPGFAQLGGVWLPLSHILPLVFIWNNWAWHSGFAGSFFSMLAYVISVWAIYKTVLLITKKQVASIIGSLAFAFNLNMLYLQTTPMTEPLYIGLFTLSALVFTYYMTTKDNTKYLLILGFLGFLQVLTRYDGWFVILVEGLAVCGYEYFIAKRKMHEVFGKLFLFGAPVAFGIGLWLMWNLLIFKDMFFFAFGPYSAHAQQAVMESNGELITKGNIVTSFITYSYAVLHNVGIYLSALAVAGAGVLLFNKSYNIPLKLKALFILFLTAPIIFNILALFLGFSIILTPPVFFDQILPAQGPWFNIRYGLLGLPLVAVLVGVFAGWRKLAIVIACLVIVLQSQYTYNTGIASLIDGTVGKSSFYASDISSAFQSRVKPDDKVLMSLYSFNQVAFKSGINLDQVVHEGVNKEWRDALNTPEVHVNWIVMANTSGDQVYRILMNEHKKEFLKHFDLVYTGSNASIYKNKEVLKNL